MHQMKSVQWIVYYLGYNITTIAKNTWPWLFYIWPWLLSLTLTLMYDTTSGSKIMAQRWFSWFSICLTLTLTFQGHLIFENSPFVPLHDWCIFWSDMFINSGDIAHWTMEKRPILYNGNCRCHGNVCYVFRINAVFCKLHRIGPSNMCINFENNRLQLTILEADFHFS